MQMRTVAILGLLLSIVLIITMIFKNQIIMWSVLLAQALCLKSLAGNEDALSFTQEKTNTAMWLEIAMFTSTLTVVVAALNAHYLISGLGALTNAVCWYVFLQFAPPYSEEIFMWGEEDEDGKQDN
ncbi:MAG: hypothetical protein AUK16_02165 [Parcubacteria group bacterium CG2_30_44_11]|nr:MAG: hypothetical protein AUK16_02165 [Parcubacteria group bacterium CG2_30_44_11]